MNNTMLICFSKEELIEKILNLDKRFSELVKENEKLKQEIEFLRQQNGALKKKPQKPDLKPNKLENSSSDENKESTVKKKWSKSSKALTATKTIRLEPSETVPKDATFIDCKSYVVQDITFEVNVIEYQLARYKTAEGKIIQAKIPEAIEGSHFGPGIIQYIIYHNQQLRVPQNKILQALKDKNVQISEGQINNILVNSEKLFTQEYQNIFQAGLKTAKYVQADDTGAIHQNKNGVCTHIGNELFSYFVTTDSKSRLNLFHIFNQNKHEYTINDTVRAYMKTKNQHESKVINAFLSQYHNQEFKGQETWNQLLQNFIFDGKLITKGLKKSLTEGALYGSLIAQGYGDLVFLSDAAPQFRVFNHAGCWVHAIRSINNLIPKTKSELTEYTATIKTIKEFYQKLKEYKIKPSQDFKVKLLAEFDQIFLITDYNFAELQNGMININQYKNSLLLVLDYPFIPLHNNGSESEIREYVIKRKISGGTRTQTGKKLRDIFTTLSKTCRKQNVSFWKFLSDRLHRHHKIPDLGILITQRSDFIRSSPKT